VGDLLLEDQAALLHHSPGRHIVGPSHADDPLQPDDLETVSQRGPAPLGGQPPTPHRRVQLPAHLDLVRARPAWQLIQPDLTKPAAGLLVDRRPRSEVMLPPLAPEVLEHPDGALPRPGPAIDTQEPRHARIAEQGDQPLKVVVVPASQQQAGGLEVNHRWTVAEGVRRQSDTPRLTCDP
jgi:hypothetical protein